MDTNTLAALSDQIASIVDRAAPSVVQVHGRRRPVSGVAYAKDIIITNARALGRSDAVKVNAADGRSADGELAGWDPATGLAAIKVEGLGLTPFVRATAAPRPGHIAIAIGRSWSNAVTASTGIVAVVGGPLRTGHGRQIDQIIRVTAPMHGGFAGGAVLDAAGQLIGIGTAVEIRGLALANCLVLLFAKTPVPLGIIASAIVMALILRRVWIERSAAAAEQLGAPCPSAVLPAAGA